MGGQKGFISILIILLGVLLILGVVSGAYYLGTQKNLASSNQPVTTSEVPTPPASATDQTVNWKLYENKQLGFSIKYPPNKFTHLTCPGEGLILEVRDPNVGDEKILDNCGRDGRFPIEVQAPPDSSSSVFQNPPKSSSDYQVVISNLTIAGQTATRYIVTVNPNCKGLCSPQWQEIVILKIAGKEYNFYLGNQDDQPDFDQMLTTFKLSN